MSRRDRNTTDNATDGEMCRTSASQDEVLNSFLQDLCFWDDGGCHNKPNSNNTSVQSNSIHRDMIEEVSPMSVQHSSGSSRQSGSGEKKVQATTDVNAAHNWKTAVDSVSGRTYYYNDVTRATQWEKPVEVKAMEKKKKKEKRMRDVSFFREMEQNLKASLRRGELIPTIPRADTEKEGPPLEPELSRPTPARVRTISAMNEHLLLELRDDKDDSTRGAEQPKSSVVSRPSTAPGRPPLPLRRNSHSSNASSSSSKQKAEADPDPFELSPELPARVYLTKQHSSGDSDALQGEFLLDEPILNEGASLTLGSSLPSPDDDGDKVKIARPAPLNTHKRVNTGGTIWLKSTMENPDIKATIQCVCGVYRAHIVQACKQHKQGSPNSSTTIHVDLDVFRDDYEYARGNINSSNSKDLPIPSLADIDSFYQKFFQKAQMEHDTIIMSLIYVERLIKETNGYLTPRPDNWASVLFSCMILASKVWDDLSMWNIDFSNVSLSPGMSPFSLKRINQLEIAVLTCLNFNVRVPASEYAKYYFLIRTMLTRSGLLEQATAPLNKEETKRLENRTSNYQDKKLKGQRVRSRAKSFDWNLFGSKKADTSAGPVLRENVCLEELLVSMNR